MAPTISVILPVHNGAAVPAGLPWQSVLAQTYADFELIAIDDGSTDGSADVLRSFP